MEIKFYDKDNLVIGGGDWELAPFKFSKILKIGGGTSPSYIDIIISGTTSVTLTNAIGLNYVKLFGGCEQRNLPYGYTQLEYLENSGTGYVNTGIVLNTIDLDVEINFQMTDTSSSASPNMTWGYMGTSNTPRWGFGAFSGGWIGTPNLTSVQGTLDTSRHTAIMRIYTSSSDIVVYDGTFDGDILYAANNLSNQESFEGNTLPVYLFARNNNGTTGNNGLCKIYNFKVRKAGKVIHNLVPCKNASNELGFYDLITDTFLIATGTLTAGSVAVPTPDNPMDIVSNNGVVKYGQYGKNLFDEQTMKSTNPMGYNDTQMWWRDSESATATAIKVPVQPNTTYTLSYTGGNRCLIGGFQNDISLNATDRTFCDFIIFKGGTQATSPKTFTTPNDCHCVCCGLANSAGGEVTNIQLELGSIATTYEPYHFGLHVDGTVETVEITGKNLYNKENGVLFGYPTGNNTWYQKADATAELSIMVQLKEGSTYTVTRAGGSMSTFRIQASATSTLTNGQTLVDVNSTGGPTATTKTFTVPYGAPYVLFYVRNTSSQSSLTVDDVINAFQVELGSTATTYEPYYNGGTVTAEMLLAVGSYQDVQSVLDGAVTRNIGVKVFDGTESFSSGQASGVQCIQIAKSAFGISSDTLPNDSLDLICTHYKAVNGSDWEQSKLNTIKVGNGYLFFNTQYAQDSTSFKAYLADQYANGTPVIVVYPLATATTETVESQSLTIQAGSNVVEITQASMDNLELEVSYKGKEGE